MTYLQEEAYMGAGFHKLQALLNYVVAILVIYAVHNPAL